MNRDEKEISAPTDEGPESAASSQSAGAEAPWHHLKYEEVLKRLEADEKGLSKQQVEERLARFGPNSLPEPGKRSVWMRLLSQFHNVLIYVLLVAAAVTGLLEHWIDTWVILAVVVINALIGFIQEGKAEKALESIRKMLSLEASVLRDDRRRVVDATELVPGDIVYLESGDKVPADMRLTYVRNLRIEESALTGESVATEKETDPAPTEAVPGDRHCMAFSGTSVVYGRATGVVTETGASTEIGKINLMMTEVEQITTPLLRQIAGFGKVLSVVILGLTAFLFLIGYVFHDYTIDELFLAVISLAVAAIPEGLPAIMTITLAIGVQAMARRNAIIRKLPSVETLGSVSVICSDKTGTLTRNEMTVRGLATAGKQYEVEGTGYEPEGDILSGEGTVDPEKEPVLGDLIRTLNICNDARLNESEEGWQVDGDPTEGALVTLGMKAGMDSSLPDRIDHLPFESEHQYMATLNDHQDRRVIHVKGAPERVLKMCTRQLGSQGEEALDREYWSEKMEQMAGKGYRLIAAAYKPAQSDRDSLNHEDLQEDMVFLGLAGMIDPPRPEAIRAVEECKKAGILVKMITGDHLVTARAIGREMGIGDGEKAVSGAEIESMSDEELREVAEVTDIFARTSPGHKLRLVKVLQEAGHICAMTGDGVNDAPALKRADVGIAMGIKGTEVTKDASEMVLADDNFATIANAVEGGRAIYDNLQKAILFILPTNGAESLVIMAAVLIGIILPITPVQILWVNMVTAVTLALALSFEPAEKGVMKRPPRDTTEPIMGGYMIWRIVFVSTLIGGITLATYYGLRQNGYEVETARTIAVNTLVAGQLFYMFNCRHMHSSSLSRGFLHNRVAFWAAGILVVLQLLFSYAPLMNLWFGTVALEVGHWIYPAVGGVTVFVLVELEKYLFGRRRKPVPPTVKVPPASATLLFWIFCLGGVAVSPANAQSIAELQSPSGDTLRPFGCPVRPPAGLPEARPSVYRGAVVNIYPHDHSAFTQGLIYQDGYLYESTGRLGESDLRKLDLQSGEVLRLRRLDDEHFGEGLTIWNDRLIQLTLHSELAFVYERSTFELLEIVSLEGEAWGVTSDDRNLIMSDGTADLKRLDPESFRMTGRISVFVNGEPLTGLNELEMVGELIYANILFEDRLAMIDPSSGRVTGWLLLDHLLTPEEREPHVNVLNGTAWDSHNDRLFVTGKLWPRLFEIRCVELAGR